VAETLGAAWAVAATADPVAVVPPGGVADALRPLPAACLRLPADTLDLLGRLGVATVDHLTGLSRAGLAERFGPTLLACLDRAFGRAPEVLVPHRPPPKFEVADRFELPTERRDVLDAALGDMVGRLAADLSAHGRGAVTLAVELGCGPDERVRFEVGLYRPTDLAKPLGELVRLHCERLTLPGPVDCATLRADATVRLRPRQGPLFGDPAGGGEPLAALVARLSSRLGPDAVVRPVAQADSLPERAYRYEPLVGRPKGRASAGRLPASVNHRPLRLFAPPVLVEVEGEGVPAAFRWRGRQAVARWWGPERIETGWWRRGGVRRDYYRAETPDGRRFWLFRDLTSGAWFLHGSFE
jgi:protein ImuB